MVSITIRTVKITPMLNRILELQQQTSEPLNSTARNITDTIFIRNEINARHQSHKNVKNKKSLMDLQSIV